MSTHEPTFTTYRGTHGVVCECGYTYGGGNDLAARSWYNAHFVAELTGMRILDAYDLKANYATVPVPTTEAAS